MVNGHIPKSNGVARLAEERTPFGMGAAGRGRSGRSESVPLVDIARTAAEDLLDLLASQVKLARFELASDLKKVVGPVVALALFLPMILVGYVFGLATVASWLSGFWGWPTALGAIAASQIGMGGLGAGLALRRLRGRRILERAESDMSEFAENVRQTIVAVVQPARSVDV